MDLRRLIAKGLRTVLQPPALTCSELDKTAKVCAGSHINYSKIGRYSYIGHDSFVLHANIGPFSSIGDSCKIGGEEHVMSRVSTSPVFAAGRNVLKKNYANLVDPPTKPITIGADVWIGAGAIVKSGVSIGTGAVIGAGSVVTHDVSPYAIVAGSPASLIRFRFDPETIEKLLASAWWEQSEEYLEEHAQDFENPEVFLSRIELG